ncbi:MAG TPA: hypothetical protein VJA47_01110 [archaeon]|nr:hypothetical protein [archaeon]
MISTFEIFKIIIGIIIAGFFLFFALKFLGVLTPQQVQNIEIAQLSSVKNSIEKTPLYGVSQNLSLKVEMEYSPPYISRKNNVKIHESIPFFLGEGDFVYIYPNSLDLGFWKMGWVGVVPETKLIYNPLIYTTEAYRTISQITEQFPESSSPLVRFGLCGAEVEYTTNTKTNFLKPIKGIVDTNQSYQIQNFSYTECTRPIADAIKVTISESEVNITDSFVIVLGDNEVGKILFTEDGKAKTLAYKDALDIFSILIGGEQAYMYKNKMEFASLLTFLKEESSRLEILRRVYSNSQYRNQECSTLIAATIPNIDNMKTIVEATASSENYGQQEMELFNELVGVLAQNYNDLESRGC